MIQVNIPQMYVGVVVRIYALCYTTFVNYTVDLQIMLYACLSYCLHISLVSFVRLIYLHKFFTKVTVLKNNFFQ